MELKDLYYVIAGVVMLITLAGSYFNSLGKIELVKQDLENHKLNHARLEERVIKHEDKIDEKLQDIQDKLSEVREIVMQLKNKE